VSSAASKTWLGVETLLKRSAVSTWAAIVGSAGVPLAVHAATNARQNTLSFAGRDHASARHP